MKHTMKKLLCMALAIMLLISAVPVFAAAQAFDGEFSNASAGEAGEMGVTQQTRQTQQSEDEGISAQNDSGTTTTTATSITVDAVLITHDAVKGSNTRTRTVQVPYSPTATLNDVLMNERGLNQSARTDGIVEFDKYDYRVIALNDSQSFNELTHYECGDFATYGSTPLSNYEQDGHVYLQFYRTRKLVNVTLRLDGSNHGDFIKEDVPLYSTLNLPAEFSTAKLAPNTGYYISFYKDGERLISKNSVSSYLITADNTVITGYQDLLANKPINDGNTNTSNGGSSNNGGSNNTNNGGSNNTNNGGTGSYNPALYKPVWLYVYKDTKLSAPDKYDITDGIAADGTVTYNDIYNNIILKHYNAKTNAGISMDGPYLDDINGGNWSSAWTKSGGKQDPITDLESKRAQSTVIIDVMIYNATAKSTAKADSSNPKTGDTIFVPFMVMGLTATALAAAYVFGKKRIAR